MSGERFDSGGVLARARPVLTFATVVGAEPPPSGSSRTDSPVPVPLSWSGPQLPRRSELPVISRIVRRTPIEHRRFVGPIARAAFMVKRAGLGTLLFAALGLATLGTIAGLGMRSLPEEALTPASNIPVAHAFAPMASERLLARAPLALRVDHPATLPSSTPQVAFVPVRTSPTPARALVAARATKKRTSSIVALHR
jgi:hypothetical protein